MSGISMIRLICDGPDCAQHIDTGANVMTHARAAAAAAGWVTRPRPASSRRLGDLDLCPTHRPERS